MAHFKNNATRKDWIYFTIGILSAVLFWAGDVLTKQLIIHKVPFNGEIVVIKDFFSITHIRNTGAAWGIFSSKTDILSIVTIFCALLILYAIYAATVNRPMMICLAAILGGACGNLVERLSVGYVTDFLSFNIFGYDFPHFNFADICITVGCITLAVYIIFIHKKDMLIFREGTIAHKLFKD